MDAIVTAGGIPEPGEPLYELTQGRSKALLDMAGKPMVQWVLDAISASQYVGRVIVIGLDETAGLTCEKPLSYLENHGSMVANTIAGGQEILRMNPDAEYMLFVSSDIPTITGEMVDWLIAETKKTDVDVYYNAISKETMDKRFPGSKRSFIKFKDVEICGGDMTIFRTRLIAGEKSMFQQLIAARKNVIKQASLIGWGTLILLLLRQLTLDGAAERAGRKLGVTAQALRCPYAELGMDVDKPFQLEMLLADLQKQVGA
jgi:GTP:adenosylcobinamide-phosphate guanylyltransferase